jgi:hypothetical protein
VLQSLHRTWLALALASVAVSIVAFFAGRDLVRDVFPVCSSTLEERSVYGAGSGELEPVFLDSWASAPSTTPSFQLRFDEKITPHAGYAAVPQYSNVRIVWNDLDRERRPCTCGSLPIFLWSEAPSDLRLFRERGAGERYVVKGRWPAGTGYDPSSEVRVAFTRRHVPTRHFESDRVFTMRHLPALIALLAMGALGLAFARSRRAMSYAQRIHTWTEASLTGEGLLEGETGMTLGTLEQSRLNRVPPGPVLVAPEALGTAGLYRDMPIVPNKSVEEGTHARWASGTMVRLRDARTLAVVSTLCTALAFGARFVA